MLLTDRRRRDQPQDSSRNVLFLCHHQSAGRKSPCCASAYERPSTRRRHRTAGPGQPLTEDVALAKGVQGARFVQSGAFATGSPRLLDGTMERDRLRTLEPVACSSAWSWRRATCSWSSLAMQVVPGDLSGSVHGRLNTWGNRFTRSCEALDPNDAEHVCPLAEFCPDQYAISSHSVVRQTLTFIRS